MFFKCELLLADETVADIFFKKHFFFFSFCLAVLISARELQNEAAGQF